MRCLFGFSGGNYALALFVFPILVRPQRLLPMSSPTMSSPASPASAQVSTMAPTDRSRGRDVHIYDAKDPTIVLGGLILKNGVTNTQLLLDGRDSCLVYKRLRITR
jgi:hypothetical protein